MSFNIKALHNLPNMGVNTAVISVPATTNVPKANAQASLARIMAAFLAGQGNGPARSVSVAGILYSAGTTAVHLFTPNSIDPGIIIAAGQTLYIPGANSNLEHASANVFGAMIFFVEDN